MGQSAKAAAARKPGPTEQAPHGRMSTASYISAISADLALMARRDRLETLAYLLDMVRLEAEGAAQAGGKTPAA